MQPIGNADAYEKYKAFGEAKPQPAQAVEPPSEEKGSRNSRRVSFRGVENLWDLSNCEEKPADSIELQPSARLSEKKATFFDRAGEVLKSVKKRLHIRRGSLDSNLGEIAYCEDGLQKSSSLRHTFIRPSEQYDLPAASVQGIREVNDELARTQKARLQMQNESAVITQQLATNIRTHLLILSNYSTLDPSRIEGYKRLLKQVVGTDACYIEQETRTEIVDEQRKQLIKKIHSVLKALPYEIQLSLIDEEFIQLFKQNGCKIVNRRLLPTVVLNEIYAVKVQMLLSSIENFKFNTFSCYLGMRLLETIFSEEGPRSSERQLFIEKLIRVHFTPYGINAINLSPVLLSEIANSLVSVKSVGSVPSSGESEGKNSELGAVEETVDGMRVFSQRGTQEENDMYMTASTLTCKRTREYFPLLAPSLGEEMDKVDAFYLYFLDEVANNSEYQNVKAYFRLSQGVVNLPLKKFREFFVNPSDRSRIEKSEQFVL